MQLYNLQNYESKNYFISLLFYKIRKLIKQSFTKFDKMQHLIMLKNICMLKKAMSILFLSLGTTILTIETCYKMSSSLFGLYTRDINNISFPHAILSYRAV